MAKESKTDEPMTAEQAALLQKIAFEAYEPEAFRPNFDSGGSGTAHRDAEGKIENDG